MKNIINISNSGEQLISSIDDGTNQLIINSSVIPESDYIGSGTYTTTVSGHSISITKTTGNNIMLIRNSEFNYSLVDVPSVTNQIIDVVYPVGSYYETSDTSFNPNTAFGGLWIEEIQGQVHISAGSSYSVSGALTNHSDGGSKDAIVVSHNHGVSGLTVSEKDLSHHHNTYYVEANTSTSGSSRRYGPFGSAASGAQSIITSGMSANEKHSHTISGTVDNKGSSGTNANMQPYIIVKRWHRVG